MSEDSRREDLVSDVSDARENLSEDYRRLGESLNPRERIEQSIREHPVAWTVGALVAGYAVASLFRGRRQTLVQSGPGITSRIVDMAVDVARPAVTGRIKHEAEQFLGRALPEAQGESQSPERVDETS